jgi:photosystem II stability/assembly factor-like uncharacterized protein
MRNYFLFAIIFFSLTSQFFPQDGWFWQNPLPQGNSLNEVCFVDANIGFVLGVNSTFMKTTDGGNTWSYISVPTNRTINGIHFVDENIGTVVGNYGTILKTTNSGLTWTTQTSGTTFNLSKVQFTDNNNGAILGSSE